MGTILKFQFYIGDITSEIYEYDLDEYEDMGDLIAEMEQDRIEWTFSQINTGYTQIS